MTTITVKYVNAPKKPGGKFGNIKDQDGATFFLPVAMLAQVTAGMKINAVTESQLWGDKPVTVIKSLAPVVPAATAHPEGSSIGLSKDELIFVTGVVGRAMGSGKFGLKDIRDLTLAAREAYDAMQDDTQFFQEGPADENEVPY